MIIWMASYPRAGNSYLKDILEDCFGLHTYSIYDELRQPKINVEAARQSPEVYFVKTHEMPQDDALALYMVRDGRDVLVSYARFIIRMHRHEISKSTLYRSYLRHYFFYRKGEYKQRLSLKRYALKLNRDRTLEDPDPQEFRKILHDLIAYNTSFGGWSPHVLAWIQREHPTVVLKFEELKSSSNPAQLVKEATGSLGYNLPSAKKNAPDFQKQHQRRPDLYRRGQVGSHQDEMPEDLEDLFWQHHGQVMEKLGYSR
jgi:hypothetical protein